MNEERLRILQVSSADIEGGAEKVAWELFNAYRRRGHRSWLAVGVKRSDAPDVFALPRGDAGGTWRPMWFAFGNALSPFVGRVRGAARLQRFFRRVADLQRLQDWWRGVEDFNFPGTWRLLEIPPVRPRVVHCHNLHGEYFDLRILPWLSHEVPLLLTLHDAQLLSGHCAHSFDCERWKNGCGHCPDLRIYPPIRRDATAYNWRRKREIYSRSRLYVATPSQWLMRKVELSMLAPAIEEARVIPNGVDLSVFHPSNRQAVRVALGIQHNPKVLLFTANGIRRNIWKDYQTLRAAAALVAKRLPKQRVLFLALGEEGPTECLGQAEVRFMPYQKDPEAVARYYQAADLYVHAARVDTFPNTVLEALACGTPVVATAVGGIPEQVKSLERERWRAEHLTYSPDEATGSLVAAGNAEEMAQAIVSLLNNEALRMQLGENAAQDALRRFDLNLQTEAYLEWYQVIDQRRKGERSSLQPATVSAPDCHGRGQT